MVMNFTTDRPTLLKNNQDSARMMQLLNQEVIEAEEVIHDPVELGRELVDILWFVMSIANINGIDLDKEFREKAAFTTSRYVASEFQDGDYYEARARIKAEEKREWGKTFYSI